MRPAYVRSRRLIRLLVVIVVLAGCSAAPAGQSGTSTQPAPSPSASPNASPAAGEQSTHVTDMMSLLAALRANGLTVEEAGTVSQPFFDVEGTTLQVQGADVQVFEFANAEAAQTAMATIGPDGNPPTMMIDWVAPPHFYQSGRLVVLYVGDDAAMTQALANTLGEQAAGR